MSSKYHNRKQKKHKTNKYISKNNLMNSIGYDIDYDNILYVIKTNDTNMDNDIYIIESVKKIEKKNFLKNHKSNYPDMDILLTLSYSPNRVILWKEIKKRLRGKISYLGDNLFILIGNYTEKNFVSDIMDIYDEFEGEFEESFNLVDGYSESEFLRDVMRICNEYKQK